MDKRELQLGGGGLSGPPHALMVTPEAPYPMAGGGPLRTASVLEYLAARFTLDVITFREPDAPDPREAFPKELVRHVHVIDLPRHSKTAAAKAARNLRRVIKGTPPLVDRFSGFDGEIAGHLSGRDYDIAVVEHFWCAGYGKLLRRHAREIVLDLHNIESVLLERCAETENPATRLAFRRFASSCRRLESEWLTDFSSVLAPSAEDKQHVMQLNPGARVVVYQNAVPLWPLPAVEKREEIVFSGNLEYHPNRSAILYFNDQVWPLVKSRLPGISWNLVGRNHESIQRRLANDLRIMVTGPVENALNTIARARVAIAPILAGSGTRFKIIEAWAAGVPVVSTSLGAEGLGAVDGKHLLLADSAQQFCDAVVRLYTSTSLQDSLAANARARYEQHFTWHSAWRQLERSNIAQEVR